MKKVMRQIRSMTMKKQSFDAIRNFDHCPDAMLVSIPETAAVISRSRASIYRHFEKGELSPVKIGNSTRIRVGEIRRLIGLGSAEVA